MQNPDISNLTLLLQEANEGRPGAFVEIVEQIYDNLRGIAKKRMEKAFKRPLDGLTMQPTEVVNEAVIDLMNQRNDWVNRDQFFAIATRLLTRIIIDYQRHRLADKRGGGQRGQAIDLKNVDAALLEDAGFTSLPDEQQLVLGAMDTLVKQHPRKAEVVTLHLVCELALPKIAEVLEISLATVERDWRFARAWLKDHLSETGQVHG